jgi:hypothetical protein
VSPEIAARLETLNIQWMVNEAGYAVFTRGDLIAIAQCAEDRIASLGSTGIMTDNGLAYLAWREDRPVLAAHGGKETPATSRQVETIRDFSAQLKAALRLSE